MDVLSTQGIDMPRLGFGTFRLTGDDCREAVESALELGYRHIDTAEMYDNEEAVGAAIAASGLGRSDLFVTTKVWHEHLEPLALRRSLDASLEKLKLDAVDLYLIHWPAPDMDMRATLDTLTTLREEGLARAIGVCNFPTDLLKTAIEEIGAPIACNQIEYHVYLDQTPVRRYLADKGIPIVAYAPLAHATVEDDPVIQKIGRKHGATPSQIALAWLLDQEDVAAIPKARSRAHQQSNLDALKIALDDDDRGMIAALPKDRRRIDPPWSPRWDQPAA
jgi:2,5-diketo-D-gluconate reductase B